MRLRYKKAGKYFTTQQQSSRKALVGTKSFLIFVLSRKVHESRFEQRRNAFVFGEFLITFQFLIQEEEIIIIVYTYLNALRMNLLQTLGWTEWISVSFCKGYRILRYILFLAN